MPEPTLDNLQHVKDPSLGTKAISRIKDKHGADVRISLGAETGPLGTWINFYVRGTHVVALDYFAGHFSPAEEQRIDEGATIYVPPRYL